MSIGQAIVYAVIGIGFASVVSSIALLAYLIAIDLHASRRERVRETLR